MARLQKTRAVKTRNFVGCVPVLSGWAAGLFAWP